MTGPAEPTGSAAPEREAFLERAIREYGKATYNFAFRLTGNEADAGDLTQEAFIRVYRAWKSFRPGTSFLSWIYRIVTNLHRDELRRRKGRYQEEIRDVYKVAPIDDYVEGHFSEPLAKALAELDDAQREIVLLADVEGLRYQEIAEIVGCTIGTVRSRLHRARGRLRTLVDQYMKSAS